MKRAFQFLTVMSKEDLDNLARQLDRINSLLGIARAVTAGVVACVVGLITVAVWANSTTAAVASSQVEIRAIKMDRAQNWRDINEWRGRKDIDMTRILNMLENQQHLLDRQQQIIDRLSLK